MMTIPVGCRHRRGLNGPCAGSGSPLNSPSANAPKRIQVRNASSRGRRSARGDGVSMRLDCRVAWAISFLAGVPSVVPFAGASTLESVSLSELTRRSPLIVHGTVTGAHAVWNEDHTLIVTEVRIRVTTSLRGQAPAEITVTQPGGRVGKLRVDVDGASPFRVGDEAVLFLAPASSGRYAVSGLSRGRFDVTLDPRSGKKQVIGVDLAGPGSEKPGTADVGRLGSPESPSRTTLDLDAFLGAVRDLVAGAESGGGR